jgi:hypothetical protein
MHRRSECDYDIIAMQYLSVGHPPYFTGLDYIYEDRGEVKILLISCLCDRLHGHCTHFHVLIAYLQEHSGYVCFLGDLILD